MPCAEVKIPRSFLPNIKPGSPFFRRFFRKTNEFNHLLVQDKSIGAFMITIAIGIVLPLWQKLFKALMCNLSFLKSDILARYHVFPFSGLGFRFSY